MNFGFSYIGLVYMLMLAIPNVIWTKNKPKGYEKYVLNENKMLLDFEKIGEILVTCTALVFSDFNLQRGCLWTGWLALSFAFMLIYEMYWCRYFKSQKTMKDFYSSILGIPVAGATLPVLAFLFLGIYGRNALMIISVVILAIGHIGIHLNHFKEII